MNRRDLHYVLTQYTPGEDCGCKVNTYEWAFCPKHKAMEDARHADAIEQHRAARELDWINE